MRIFQCQQCNHVAFFENTACEQCGAALGFEPTSLQLLALQPAQNQTGQTPMSFAPVAADTTAPHYVYCDNHQHGVCNWLIPASSGPGLCAACELNRYVPNLQDAEQQAAWQSLEQAKHRLLYSLYRLGLPVQSKTANPDQGMEFDFINPDKPVPEDAAATTGHADGQVTVNVREADAAEREQTRKDLNESYRTVLGHFRHEIGHYYWDVLIRDDPDWLARCREVFGDERADYGQALQQHYANGPAPDWPQYYVSAYAASHPWEDWAETWAHYLHLLDTLETAAALGVAVQPSVNGNDVGLSMATPADPYLRLPQTSVEDLLHPAVNLTLALNSLNRSMGQPDSYPFVLNDSVRTKLGFIHERLQAVMSQANAA